MITLRRRGRGRGLSDQFNCIDKFVLHFVSSFSLHSIERTYHWRIHSLLFTFFALKFILSYELVWDYEELVVNHLLIVKVRMAHNFFWASSTTMNGATSISQIKQHSQALHFCLCHPPAPPPPPVLSWNIFVRN